MKISDSNINIIRVAETDSTSKEIVREFESAKVRECESKFQLSNFNFQKSISVLQADYQTAGRGQQGNSWESERGKNLLFSIMLWPHGVEVKRQFRLSQAMAVALCEELETKSQTSNLQSQISIKWPNDIYYGENKLSGTIIETTWAGDMVERCVLGVGINVNQQVFCSDAPNPISLYQIVGHEVDRDELLAGVLQRFVPLYERLMTGDKDELVRRYVSHLFWREGLHRYSDADGEFEAEIVDVAADGHLTLRDTEGRERCYYFKELKFEF